MEFRKVLALRGPNIWVNFPVLEAWVDLGAARGVPIGSLPGILERLLGLLPVLHERGCDTGHSGGLCGQVDSNASLALVLQQLALALQSAAWKRVEFGRSCETQERGVFRVVVEYHDETLARACLETARRLCLATMHNHPFDVNDELDRLKRLAYRVCLGPSTSAIVSAAAAMGIPWRRLNDESLVQLGHGVRQRRIRTAETDRTSVIAESIAQDKHLTRMLLRAVGVPVPPGRPVEDAEDAWAAAQEIQAPVVVKHWASKSTQACAKPVCAVSGNAPKQGGTITPCHHHLDRDGTGAVGCESSGRGLPAISPPLAGRFAATRMRSARGRWR